MFCVIFMDVQGKPYYNCLFVLTISSLCFFWYSIFLELRWFSRDWRSHRNVRTSSHIWRMLLHKLFLLFYWALFRTTKVNEKGEDKLQFLSKINILPTSELLCSCSLSADVDSGFWDEVVFDTKTIDYVKILDSYISYDYFVKSSNECFDTLA